MKRAFSLLLAAGLAATWLGCQPAPDSPAPPADGGASASTTVPPSLATDADAPAVTLVSLKVPNMT